MGLESVVLLLFGFFVAIVLLIAFTIDNRAAIRRLRERIHILEQGRLGGSEAPAQPAAPAPVPAVAPRLPPQPRPIPAPDRDSAPVSATAAPAPSPRRSIDTSRLEQLIGGIWLQNVGSVLLLLGTFFLILWGYTNGKIGPEVLVGAGVALGVVLAWRGDRLARSIRPLGHALLGVGLGVVYITIYLGHFRMHVFSEWVTFGLLALLSFISVDIGLRRQQAIIATLGVIGAVLPLILGPVSGAGFHLEHRDRLGYLALVNAVVFALAMARGWSGLVLAALIGTTVAWTVDAASGSAWGLATQVGLAAMYVALGIAVVAQLVRTSGSVGKTDIATVTLAPILLLTVSVPFFQSARSAVTGSLLAGLGVIHVAVAHWVDSKRSDRDLWRPLIAVGTLFVTASLERFLDPAHLTLAWTAEGALLVWIGLAPRGGWFRVLGYAVSALAVLRLLSFTQSYAPGAGGGLWFMNATAIQDLVALAILFAMSERLQGRRDSLTERERFIPNLWLAAVHFSIMLWTLREAPYAARALHSSAASAPIVAFVWAVQGGALLYQSLARGATVPRAIAYAIAGLSFLAFLWGSGAYAPWQPGDRPVLYPAGIFLLLTAAVYVALAQHLRSRRERLGPVERQAPEGAALIASVAFMIWSAREAGRVANALMPGQSVDPSGAGSTAMLAAVLTSAAWLVQAGILLVIGWTRQSAFFRWSGLGLVGVTTLKFVLLDLERVDVFWRFVTALGVGAVMLLVSFAYQRRRRVEEGTGG